MPQFTFSTSIGAGGTLQPLTGWQYEYLPFSARVEIGIQGSAVGLVGTVSSGSDVLQEESVIGGGGTAGVLPSPLNVPFLVDDAAAGDRLKINLRNPTGGAITAVGIVKITPIG